MGKRKKKKETAIFQSTIARIVAAIIILVFPLNIMTIVLSTKSVFDNKEQLDKVMQTNLDIGVSNLERQLTYATKRMLYLSYGEEDFIALSHPSKNSSDMELGMYLIGAQEMLKTVGREYEFADLMYFHFMEKELIIINGYSDLPQMQIREQVRTYAKNPESTGMQWESTSIDNIPVLIGNANWNQASFGMILQLDKTLAKLDLYQEVDDRVVFFTNADGTVMTTDGSTFLEEQQMSYEMLRTSGKYIVMDSKLSTCDLYLVEAVPWSSVIQDLPISLFVMQFLAFAMTLLVIPLLLWYVRYWVSRPLNRLVEAIGRIEQGDLDYRINSEQEGREFEQINRNFNSMMDQVQELKIGVYEKELERKNIKMRYLSQQIQPHFILNAMNILYSYEPEEFPLIQKMILCISKYFRYIVKVNADFVELGQEMEHIRNYFEIQKARFPGLFFSIVEYEEGLKHALIPPLLVQNFAENAIKHSLSVGNKVTIFVITEYYTETDGMQMMRIRLADTGVGISDEVLMLIENFQNTGEHQEGLGVGIENAIERLKYLYGDCGKIRFWRDEQYQGTNVEILLPIYFKGEKDADSTSG